MNGKNLSDVLSDIDLKYIDEVELFAGSQKKPYIKWLVPVAAALILLAGIGVVYRMSKLGKSLPVKPTELDSGSYSQDSQTDLSDNLQNADNTDYTTNNNNVSEDTTALISAAKANKTKNEKTNNNGTSNENHVPENTTAIVPSTSETGTETTTSKNNTPTSQPETTEQQGQKEDETTQVDYSEEWKDGYLFEIKPLSENQEYLNATDPYAVSRHQYYETPLHYSVPDGTDRSSKERFHENRIFEEYRWLNKSKWLPAGDFIRKSTPVFLAEKNGKNAVYSPINAYFALSLLAETSSENTRNQVLSALNENSITSLRERANGIWKYNYYDDSLSKCLIANSIWLNDKGEYNKDTLDIIAENYYASAFSGEMGSEGYNNAFRQWMNTQTGNMLKNQISNLKFDNNTDFVLASTLYLKLQWSAAFDVAQTKPGKFKTASGKKVSADFMYQKGINNMLYYGDNFNAVRLSFSDNLGHMLLILPDEGVTPETLLKDSETMDFILSNNYTWNKQKKYDINYYVPKFDMECELDLTNGMKKLGITDCFDPEKADFSSLTKAQSITLSKAKQGVRVAVDENGVTAASYTVEWLAGGFPEDCKEINFKLNRPFLYVIRNTDNMPLFIGIVNNPS